MAQYEVKAQGKAKVAHTAHDRQPAIDWAEAQTLSTGVVYEVYEIKHVHLTSKVQPAEFEFF